MNLTTSRTIHLRGLLLLILLVAIWLKLGLTVYHTWTIPNAPYPHNSSGQNLVHYYLSTLWGTPP